MNDQFDHEVLRRKLARGEKQELVVVSDSMEPLIKTGDKVEVIAVPVAHELKLFDIVLFRQAGRLNAHILTKIDREEDHFVTRPLKDPRHQDYPLKLKDIIGVISNKKVSWWQKLRVLLLS